MSVLISAINRQMDVSIYENPSATSKFKLVAQCQSIKKILNIALIAAPIFACFFPYIFGVISSLTIGLIGYDIFNMADNVGDAAKISAEGGWGGITSKSNIETLLDRTILAGTLYRSFYASNESPNSGNRSENPRPRFSGPAFLALSLDDLPLRAPSAYRSKRMDPRI